MSSSYNFPLLARSKISPIQLFLRTKIALSRHAERFQHAVALLVVCCLVNIVVIVRMGLELRIKTLLKSLRLMEDLMERRPPGASDARGRQSAWPTCRVSTHDN